LTRFGLNHPLKERKKRKDASKYGKQVAHCMDRKVTLTLKILGIPRGRKSELRGKGRGQGLLEGLLQ